MAEEDSAPLFPGYIKMIASNGRDSQDMDDLVSSLQERVALLEREKETLQQELQTALETLEDFKQEMDFENKRLIGELKMLKWHRNVLEQQVDEHKHATRELEERILYLEKQLQKKEEELKASPNQWSIVELQDRAKYLEKKVSELEAEKMAYLKERKRVNLQEEEKVILEVVSQRNSEIKRLSAHIEGMKRELANMQQLVDGSQTSATRQVSTSIKDKPHPLPRQSSNIVKTFSRIYSIPPSPPPAPPKLVNFNWEREIKSAPRMTRGTIIVDEQNSVCYFSSSVSPEIHAYHIYTKKWNKLPDCPHLSFGMAIVSNCLTAVGGEKGRGPTGDLISYVSGVDQLWVEMFPPMTVKRSNPSAVTSEMSLIVAGGVTQQLESKSSPRALSSVEIMNTETLQWSQAAPLPKPTHSLSLAVCREMNKLYLLGGEGAEQSAFVCNIPKLINSHAIHNSHTHQQQKVWRVLEDVPTAYATCAVIHGHLVAFGGIETHGDRDSSNGIYAYHDISEGWRHTGLLPTPRSRPLVASLPGGVVMVVGGFTRVEMLGIVEVASVQDGRNLRAGSM